MSKKNEKLNIIENTSSNMTLTVLDKKTPNVKLPVLTGMRCPFFPDMNMNVIVSGRDIHAVRKAVKHFDGKALVVLRKWNGASGSREEFYKVGTLCEIQDTEPGSKGELKVIFNSIARMSILSLENVENVVMAEASVLPDTALHNEAEHYEVQAKAECLVQMLKKLVEVREYTTDTLRHALDCLEGMPIARIGEFACTVCPISPNEAQAMLETLDCRERLEKGMFICQRELALDKMRKDIMNKVVRKFEKNNHITMLNEVLKEVKRELGTDIDSTEKDIEKIQERLDEIRDDLNDEARQRIYEEIDKLRSTQKISPDYAVIKNYLSWLTDLPWNVRTEDCLEVQMARKVLDRDHYGIQDVKKRILEFIGVSKLKGRVDGSLLCLVGPPGVGKTSLGRSIAEALGRKFFRFSLGGMKDESEIKGHRRTYIGAMPGKIISAMKITGSMNPVIMLDEIDKLGMAANHGDPSSALLEVLDPEQNFSFRDHFLDVPFDLSKVLFIATANSKESIPEPLLDRMEVINLSGYIMDEKLAIARKHLIPKQLPKNGLKKGNISFTTPILKKIILDYARDPGVRSLEHAIAACMRGVAMKIAEGKAALEDNVPLLPDDLEKYIGKQVFFDDPLVTNPIPGVVMGLAWTSMGGTTLYIESLPMDGEAGMKLTGQLGDVMKESAQIAMSLVEKNAEKYGIAPDFFKKHKFHIHVPAGATPKDGPSAGITITTAIISSILGRPLPPCWAMTGEITLTARVLPVGGIREKMIAAIRSGVRDVILPKLNEKDFNSIPENVRKGLNAHFVSEYSEVWKLLFPAG